MLSEMKLREAVLNVSAKIHEVGDILLHHEYGRNPYKNYFFKVMEKLSNGGYKVKPYLSNNGKPFKGSDYSETYVPSVHRSVHFSRAPKESYAHIRHLKDS